MTANIDYHQKTYVCIHVFDRSRPVLLVSREEGAWQMLCGDGHPSDAAYYRVVGIGHVLENDPSLLEVVDLDVNFDAERSAVGQPWQRYPTPADEA